MAEPLLELHGVSRRFRAGDTEVRALEQVSLAIRRGEFVAIMGPSGSGKSTLMNVLGCLDRADAGSYRIGGRAVAELDDDALAALRRDTFGFVFQRYHLLPGESALENVEMPALYAGVPRAERARRATALLARLGLADRIRHRPSQLSGGQQQRVALARALLHDPEVLFLDEPTSGLDPAATRDVVELIGALASEHGRTVVLCTHFLGEAGRLADRMAVLHRGVLHAFGRPEAIAADLWDGLDARVDVGGPLGDDAARAVLALDGVAGVAPLPEGAVIRVADREVLPVVVRTLVEAGLPVYGADARPPSLEDVYFAVEARIAAAEGRDPAPRAADLLGHRDGSW